ncbi:MAG: chromosome segregation protein SMC [Candidatus Lutacidiplasmatales archaeon]
MYLKRIKLRNFKSFSGATEVPFRPGFTGVAGPNGMGKSNISDAILFVLGPTSSKALRAERLTHLFFNGGANKKAATECEVSLVFDNADRLLPVDSADVEISRYVKLAPSDANGYYSYFYVNGKRSTQTQIDGILSHARLSGDGYNLVQQGDVNRIVSMGPIPRRGLLERLAGISQYDEELERAETKRTDLEANLSRFTTLLGEIRSHLTALESQRLQAIQYRDLQDQKRKAEARLARAGHLLARQEVESCSKQLTSIGSELEALRRTATQLEAERDELNQAIGKIEGEIAHQGGPEAERFRAELEERRMAFARLDASLTQGNDELESLAKRLTELAPTLETEEKESKRLELDEKSLSKKLAAAQEKVKGKTGELQQAMGESDPSQGKLVGVRKQILILQKQQGELQSAWEASVRALEEAKATFASAERENGQAEDDERTRELELKDLELRVKQAGGGKGTGEATPDLQKTLFQERAREKSLGEEVQRLSQEVLELNRRYMALDARLKARTESGARPSALAAVDFLLSQRNLGKVEGIRGTVEELAKFEPENQTALQVAAGSRFQALVVETDQVAEECIKLLRAEKRGRATFLPLNRMLPSRPHGKSLVAAKSSGAVGFALDLVHFDEELRPAFWYVFGETVVMDDLAHARTQMGGVRLVTRSGDLIEATGAISGGYLESGDKGRGADSAVELKRLGEELRAKSQAEAAARTELENITLKVRAAGEELSKRSIRAEANQSALKVVEGELLQARERLKEARRRSEASAAAQKKAETARSSAESTSAKASEAVEAAKRELTHLQEEYVGKLPGALSGRITMLQAESQSASAELTTLTGELERCRANRSAAVGQLATHKSELSELDKTRAEKEKAAKSATKARDEARHALDSLRELEAKQSAAVKGKSEEKRVLEERRLKLVDKVARSQESLRTREVMAHSEEVRLATAQQRLAEVEATLKELPPEEEGAAPVPVDDLKRTIQTLSSELEGMGSVNLRALEEYDQEKKRLDEFEGEVNRLGAEKTELLGLVGEVEKKKRTKLTEVVVDVNGHFRQIYGELSGGGEGEIVLENPTDPLAGGLLIRARPVGKTIERPEQLSGGEKSLASLAFIFALQRHDPSPLYVFDEADMSLDGVNAENVGRMLRRNAQAAQFIVISLRKVTIKFAHQIFGVTMHGDGCSRVVSLNLDEIVDIDERERGSPREALVGAPTP